jgi:hypothetical protein
MTRSHVGVHWCDLPNDPARCLAIGLRQQERKRLARDLWNLRKRARRAGLRLVLVPR